MGKSLVIKGADFSQVAANLVISSAQSSLGTDKYYNENGVISTYHTVESVAKIDIPDGVKSIRPSYSTSGLEPCAINCFGENGHLGIVGNVSGFGSAETLGNNGWYNLLDGTTSISYIYKSTFNDFDLGLEMKWIAK